MSSLSLQSMQSYLSQSISSLNNNKIYGMMAEIDFRNYLQSLNFSNRVSVGGWVARSTGAGNFGHNTIVVFPEIIQPNINYQTLNNIQPPIGLHTICSTFRQLGIKSYYCKPVISVANDPLSIQWEALELGVPFTSPYINFPQQIQGYMPRTRRYNFLKYLTNVSNIPNNFIPEEFSKEHLRVSLSNSFMTEMSDVDGIFWGNQFTYPLEIKEKTVANDSKVGDYFGLDLGPFVKLAHYAAKRGNLHSLFIVKEIDNQTSRNLVNWLYITFDQLAEFASWVPASGGRSMTGGSSTVVKIPKAEFSVLDANALNNL